MEKRAKWQPEYEAAVAETDIEKLKVKTAALEDAIFNRCKTIAGKPGYETERDAIQLVIDTLRDIHKTKLGFPRWEQYLKTSEDKSIPILSRNTSLVARNRKAR